MPSKNLEQILKELTKPGELFERLPDGSVRCFACAHRCLVKEGQLGACKVRFNEGGTLQVPWGYVAGLHLDPIEKKPFYHVLPGSKALSFGMLGCDYRCDFCQNWVSSQALRDPAAGTAIERCTAEDIASLAIRSKAGTVSSTYNEPLITSEWAVAVFREAKKAGIRCSYVSNGNATPEVLDYLKPWVDFYKVDLKCFDDDRYRHLMGGMLKAVLETIVGLKAMGFWVEVVTLVIPGVNDSEGELRSIARFLASVSKDIPWHVTAFHGDYKMGSHGFTPTATLQKAAAIGKVEGLRFVYAGNLTGSAVDLENTVCACGTVLVERRGFRILKVDLRIEDSRGFCPKCSADIPGIWA